MTPGTVQMGERNIAAARAALRDGAIPIIGEAVGGERGRSVHFHTSDGRVVSRTVGGDDSRLLTGGPPSWWWTTAR